MRTYYDVLGVSPSASPAEVKTAYKRSCLRWHPDRNPTDPKAHDEFIKVGKAYTTLSDAERRRAYDHQLARMKANPQTTVTAGRVPGGPQNVKPRPYAYGLSRAEQELIPQDLWELFGEMAKEVRSKILLNAYVEGCTVLEIRQRLRQIVAEAERLVRLQKRAKEREKEREQAARLEDAYRRIDEGIRRREAARQKAPIRKAPPDATEKAFVATGAVCIAYCSLMGILGQPKGLIALPFLTIFSFVICQTLMGRKA